MKFQSFVAVGVLSCFLGILPAQVGADASASKLDKVRTLHAQVAKMRDEMAALSKDFQSAKGADEKKAASSKLNELRSRLSGPQKEFTDAFAAVDWSKFDPKADAALLKDGLPGLVRNSEKPELAVAAGKFYLDKFGDEKTAENVRSHALPMALLATGAAAEATKLLEDAIAKAEPANKVTLLLTLGDICAASGDPATAAKKYVEADGLADDKSRRYVTLRKELIGKPAPDIDSKTWIGADAKSLSSLKGKVVLVDFWATWCGPCRMVMPAIDELYRANHDKGLEVVGVTRFYDHGYMAANKSEMQVGGKSVKDITKETFTQHVTDFRKNTEISYPFAIGEEADFKAYHVSGIPTLAVVGPDGNIALITVGAGSEGLLKFAVKNLLAKAGK